MHRAEAFRLAVHIGNDPIAIECQEPVCNGFEESLDSLFGSAVPAGDGVREIAVFNWAHATSLSAVLSGVVGFNMVRTSLTIFPSSIKSVRREGLRK